MQISVLALALEIEPSVELRYEEGPEVRLAMFVVPE
jgi:hypothetical protein